jgi:DNA/RNA endonuclease G (NUC1)
MDFTTIHPSSADQAHHIDLHLWRGPPLNLDETRPVQILVNQGYVVGFCPDRLQPLWSAYRVAHAEADVDYHRPIHYHDDLRLPAEHRIGRKTFGKLGGIPLDVGHMTPNEVINRQFGRLAQLETFLMSNMSPQYGSLNKGVWLKLEDSIRDIEDEEGKDHVWAIVGPVFGDQPSSINRDGRYVPVPDSYFCITVDPYAYPFDKPSNAHIDCFIIPQNAPPSSNPQDYPATLAEIEAATRLKFFTDWGREIPVWEELQLAQAEAAPQSRMMRALEAKATVWREQQETVAAAQPQADTIAGLIGLLEGEAVALQSLTRPLSSAESARLTTLQHTISWLIAARDLPGSGAEGDEEAEETANFITYNIVSDLGDRLKHAARAACNFWNRFVEPRFSIIIRLGTFTQAGNTIARAYKPYEKDGVRYGVVEFNTKYLVDYTPEQIAGTVIHEIGHTLGIGWDEWDQLFDDATGRFSPQAVERLALLAHMEVERDGGPGTALSHWDEELFDQELMTGYKDHGEYVLPVTIDLMALLGHEILLQLTQKTDLASLIEESANLVFSRQDEARRLDLTHFEPTDLFEIVPHGPEFQPGAPA